MLRGRWKVRKRVRNNTLNDSSYEYDVVLCTNRAIGIGHHHDPLKRETNKGGAMCQENKKISELLLLHASSVFSSR